MAFRIQLLLDPRSYVRDPEQTDLGRRIVDASIRLMDNGGFEELSFRRLAECIGSTQASIYRYFENKHRLLRYLVSWYWSWIDYRLEFHVNTKGLSPRARLHGVIGVLLLSTTDSPAGSHIDEAELRRIVVADSNKAYQTRSVTGDDADGCCAPYKALVDKVAAIISEAAPNYAHAPALASTLIETSHQRFFFAQPIPSVARSRVDAGDIGDVRKFLGELVDAVLGLRPVERAAESSAAEGC